VLPDLKPISAGNVIQPQRCARGLCLRDYLPSFLAFLSLYGLGFTPRCGFGTAEKAMTSHLEVVPPERRAAVLED
jgi:hypothetical protein